MSITEWLGILTFCYKNKTQNKEKISKVFEVNLNYVEKNKYLASMTNKQMKFFLSKRQFPDTSLEGTKTNHKFENRKLFYKQILKSFFF